MVVLNVNGSAALDGHVEHVDVVVHHHDVGHSAPVGVLQVKVASLGQDEPVYFLLVEDGSEVHGILAPGDEA